MLKETGMDTAQLVRLCQSHDRDALEYLYQTYSRPMKNIVIHYVHDENIAQDILHDGFIIVFSSIVSLRNPIKLELWMATIMKNLSLQYLKEKYAAIPVSEIIQSEETTTEHHTELSWEELDKIIERLPEGYGKIFRLAVLDGLSHKKIGRLLGITPHSSSSQLSRAKAMLRRLINEYRTDIGILSTIIIAILVRTNFHIPENRKTVTTIITDGKKEKDNMHQKFRQAKACTEATCLQPYKRTVFNGYIPKKETPTADNTEFSPTTPTTNYQKAKNSFLPSAFSFPTKHEIRQPAVQTHMYIPSIAKTPAWSVSLIYTGNFVSNRLVRHHHPPYSDIPSEDTDKYTYKKYHHPPLSASVTLNKALSSRWSMGIGLRYTFQRSKFISKTISANKEYAQRIHYIGIPIKFNHNILRCGKFSLCGHAGIGFDIPVKARQSVTGMHTEGDLLPTTGEYRINAPMQWSAESGLNFQYHLTPSFSVHAGISVEYYLVPKTEISIVRREKPFGISIPIGIQMTW